MATLRCPDSCVTQPRAVSLTLITQRVEASEQSINRKFFSTATQRSGELALTNWRCCPEVGDSIAHFALGYTLYELGRYHEAYRHLRYYAQIAQSRLTQPYRAGE